MMYFANNSLNMKVYPWRHILCQKLSFLNTFHHINRESWVVHVISFKDEFNIKSTQFNLTLIDQWLKLVDSLLNIQISFSRNRKVNLRNAVVLIFITGMNIRICNTHNIQTLIKNLLVRKNIKQTENALHVINIIVSIKTR